MTKDVSDLAGPTVAYGGKTADSPDVQPTLCTLPPGASRFHAATSWGPPTLSTTTSTGRWRLSSPISTSSAPISASPSPRAAEPTDAITWAPARAANWTANRPTPPEAPVTRTLLSGPSPAARNERSAATPATGRATACARSKLFGTSASAATSIATRSANAPEVRATTGVPTAGPVPSAAA